MWAHTFYGVPSHLFIGLSRGGNPPESTKYHWSPAVHTSTTESGDKAWEALLADLRADESILEETVQEIRATIPGYGKVPSASLRASARRNIALSIRTIRIGLRPTPGDVPEAEALAVERYGQGVPLGSVLAGFRVCMAVIHHRLLKKAPQAGIPVEQVLESSTFLWTLGDVFSTRAVTVYRDQEIARAVADSARRAEWVLATVTEGMEQTALLRGAALYGVPTDEPLRAIVVDTRPESDEELRRRLQRWAELVGVRVLTAGHTQSFVGIVIGEPTSGVHPQGVTVGLGRAVPLEDLPRSFASASLALRASTRVGLTGIVDLRRLSWRFGVFSSPETTEMLRERYLAPLEEAGGFGESIVEAVDAYLRHRMSIPSAARSIPIHVNTLRYRLKRFAELSGADLGDVTTLIEVSWSLAAREGAAADASEGS